MTASVLDPSAHVAEVQRVRVHLAKIQDEIERLDKVLCAYAREPATVKIVEGYTLANFLAGGVNGLRDWCREELALCRLQTAGSKSTR